MQEIEQSTKSVKAKIKILEATYRKTQVEMIDELDLRFQTFELILEYMNKLVRQAGEANNKTTVLSFSELCHITDSLYICLNDIKKVYRGEDSF